MSIEDVTNVLSSDLGREPTDEEVLDKLSTKKLFGISDKFYLQRIINPAAQYQYAYVLLDTSVADPNLSTDTVYGWRFLNYVSQETGVVCSTNNIRDIVGMRIYPVVSQLTAPIGEPNKTYVNNVVDLNHNMTVLIHEFQAQSFVGREGRKFHFVLFPFLMNPQIVSFSFPITPPTPYYEYTTSGKGNGWFWFRTPITEFSTLSVSLANPYDPIKLDKNVRTLIPIQLVFLSEKKEAN